MRRGRLGVAVCMLIVAAKLSLLQTPDSWAGQLLSSSCRKRLKSACRAVANSADGATSVVLNDWCSEAERCWGKDANGVIPGWIADMVTPGTEYDQLAKMYVKADEKPQPPNARPWQRRVEEEAGPMQQPEAPPDPRQEDFDDAMTFFGNEGNGGTILDVGCGFGYHACQFAQSKRFDKLFALDVDWKMLEVTRNAAERQGVGPDEGLLLLRADVQGLPFLDESIDFVWWGMGLHKVQDRSLALVSVARVLRPGGRLLATTIPSIMPGATAEDIEQKAKDAGFSEVEVSLPRETQLVLRAVK